MATLKVCAYQPLFFICLFTCIRCDGQPLIKVIRDTERHELYYEIREKIELLKSSPKADIYDYSIEKIRSYYNNGTLRSEYSQKEDLVVGEYRSYYPNGQINTAFSCSDGNLEDLYLEFYENGNKKTVGMYKIFDDLPRYQYDTTCIIDSFSMQKIFNVSMRLNNIKDEMWYYWDSTGVLQKKELWKRGKLVTEYK